MYVCHTNQNGSSWELTAPAHQSVAPIRMVHPGTHKSCSPKPVTTMNQKREQD